MAIGRGAENAALAEKLGASMYIDSKSTRRSTGIAETGAARR